MSFKRKVKLCIFPSIVHNTFSKQEGKIILHVSVKDRYEFLLVAIGFREMQVPWHLGSATEERGFASDLK